MVQDVIVVLKIAMFVLPKINAILLVKMDLDCQGNKALKNYVSAVDLNAQHAQ